MSDASADQLLSFLLYSLFVYPVTNYIVSPQRKYPRWKAVVYAMIFLGSITYMQLWYQADQRGPNHYQMLQVQRDSPINVIKKSYRTISLELHPDKNKAATANDDFRKLQHAFDVLVDKEKRREYNRLGDHGVAVAAQSVVDHKYLLIQLVVYYGSSLVFAFLLNLSEHGDAFSISLFGLTVVLLIEMLLVVQDYQLPKWFLPSYTPHEIVSTLHQIFPAFMNGTRSILVAFKTDRKREREAALDAVASVAKDITMRCTNLASQCTEIISNRMQNRNSSVENKISDSRGSMESLLSSVRVRVSSSKEGREGTIQRDVEKKQTILNDPRLLVAGESSYSRYLPLLYLGLYLAARAIFIKTTK